MNDSGADRGDGTTRPAEDRTDGGGGVVEPVAKKLADRLETAPGETSTLRAVLEDLGRLDLAVYRAVAVTPTPTLDDAMRRVSDAANYSRLWIAIAAAMAVFGGRAGRRTAATGLVAVGLDSLIVNVPGKLWFHRKRPDPGAAGVPEGRRVSMPTSASFPSGHTASGFAFAAAVAQTSPGLAISIRLLASIVGYSRVHTGVHYPGDVIVGSLIGTTVGETVGAVAEHIRGLPGSTA